MAGFRLLKILLFFTLAFGNTLLFAGDLYAWIDVSGGSTTVCEGRKLIVVGNASDGSGEYVKHSWSGNMEVVEFLNDQVLSIDTKNPGQYSFEYSVWDNLENNASTKITVNVNPLPKNKIESKRSFFSKLFGKKYPVKLSLKSTTDIESVTWYKNGELLEYVNSNSFKTSSDGFFRAVIVGNNGCVAYSNTIVVQ
jgi:membrane carboxypeptidase/penicillin-binding protein PbpC